MEGLFQRSLVLIWSAQAAQMDRTPLLERPLVHHAQSEGMQLRQESPLASAAPAILELSNRPLGVTAAQAVQVERHLCRALVCVCCAA